MKINTAMDLLTSIAGGLALVRWLPARSRAHFTRVLVDFRKEKEKENLSTSSESSGEFQGCFGDVF